VAPKKGQKMSLNEFLGDSGSWADEMDALPTAPALRADGDGPGRRDDYMSNRGIRQMGPPREDLPLPTQPPYTAFIGNLAFDLTEADLESFFGTLKVKSVKVIKDREERPKGFGYIEFEDLEDLKDALARSGSALSGRTIRVSVAEPPKERGGFGGGFGGDDAKFAGNWRREGPLPDLPDSRDSSRRRFDGPPGGDRERPPPSLSDNASDWRSSRAPARAEPEAPARRKAPGFFGASDGPSAADKEETWTIGGKFKPSTNGEEGGTGSKFGRFAGRGDGPPRNDPPAAPESDWRSTPRAAISRQSTSPNSSTPPTPQMGRRKLELLPRSGNVSVSPSPLASPKMPHSATSTAPRANPFGAAKPVDVSAKEKAVAERLDKEREVTKERLAHQQPMSRTSSRAGSDRTGTPKIPQSNSVPPSPRATSAVASIRPAFSFADAAGAKK
ncbi:hypothetical protein HETIRDRAFT_238319, partial [Heterobasidion irregulare TC 32-1]